VQSAVGRPSLTLPPTDAAGVDARGSGSAPIGLLVAILGVLGAVSLFAIRRPAIGRR
jgi:hypothetical protein